MRALPTAASPLYAGTVERKKEQQPNGDILWDVP